MRVKSIFIVFLLSFLLAGNQALATICSSHCQLAQKSAAADSQKTTSPAKQDCHSRQKPSDDKPSPAPAKKACDNMHVCSSVTSLLTPVEKSTSSKRSMQDFVPAAHLFYLTFDMVRLDRAVKASLVVDVGGHPWLSPIYIRNQQFLI